MAAVPQGDAFAVLDRAGVVSRRVARAPDGLPLVRVGTAGPDDPGTRAGMAVLGRAEPGAARASWSRWTWPGWPGSRCGCAATGR